MVDDTPRNPSDRAMVVLRQRIADDDELEGAVKEAILADLSGDDPAALEQLKTLLSREEQSDEADKPKGE